MNYTKIVVGSVLMLMSSILISAQYITSSVIMSSRNEWSPNAINQGLFSGGYVLFSLSIIFFIIGIVLVVISNKSN